jgi:hypothetical protein
MGIDLQKEAAGLSGAAIALIVIAGVVTLILLLWLMIWAAEESGSYYW